jgi:hypothetical protein
VVIAAACGGSSPQPPGVQLALAIAAALEAAQTQRAPWRCAAPDGPKLAEETLAIGKREWKLAGGTVRLAGSGAGMGANAGAGASAGAGTSAGAGADTSAGAGAETSAGAGAGTRAGAIAIGVIADAGGAAPRTLAALGVLRGKLAGADLVLALGGMGGSQAEIEATLGALAERAAWPVVALPGDLEPAGEQAAAIARLRGRGSVVIDGRLVRRIELPGVTIATIPGAGAAARLVAGAEGCGYRTSDVTAALGELTQRDGLRILASAEAPRITVGGEPAGELALTAGPTGAIDLALHGPTAEAATQERTGRRDGSVTALTPGSSDATTRLPGPSRAPSAGLLVIDGDAWRWKPITGTGE